MRHILRAVRDHDLHTVVFYPNSDRGHSGIAREAESACRHAKNGELRLLRSTDRETFLRTLLASDVLVGNSSSGILEAPFLGVPSVNIGPRQEGRQRGSRFIYDCDESYPAIYEVIGRALSQRPKIPARSCYGDGKTGKRIAKILAQHCV